MFFVMTCSTGGRGGRPSAQVMKGDPEPWDFRGGLSGEFQVTPSVARLKKNLIEPQYILPFSFVLLFHGIVSVYYYYYTYLTFAPLTEQTACALQ